MANALDFEPRTSVIIYVMRQIQPITLEPHEGVGMDQVVVRVVLAVAVPFKDPEGNFSALLDTVEVDIAVDRVEELKSLVKEFDVNG